MSEVEEQPAELQQSEQHMPSSTSASLTAASFPSGNFPFHTAAAKSQELTKKVQESTSSDKRPQSPPPLLTTTFDHTVRSRTDFTARPYLIKKRSVGSSATSEIRSEAEPEIRNPVAAMPPQSPEDVASAFTCDLHCSQFSSVSKQSTAEVSSFKKVSLWKRLTHKVKSLTGKYRNKNSSVCKDFDLRSDSPESTATNSAGTVPLVQETDDMNQTYAFYAEQPQVWNNGTWKRLENTFDMQQSVHNSNNVTPSILTSERTSSDTKQEENFSFTQSRSNSVKSIPTPTPPIINPFEEVNYKEMSAALTIKSLDQCVVEIADNTEVANIGTPHTPLNFAPYLTNASIIDMKEVKESDTPQEYTPATEVFLSQSLEVSTDKTERGPQNVSLGMNQVVENLENVRSNLESPPKNADYIYELDSLREDNVNVSQKNDDIQAMASISIAIKPSKDVEGNGET